MAKGSKPDLTPLDAKRIDELKGKLDSPSTLSVEDCHALKSVLVTLLSLQSAYLNSKTKLRSLLATIFGPRTEKDPDPRPHANNSEEPKPKPHPGRKKAEDFEGADRVECDHPTLKAGDICPNCQIGILAESERRESICYDGSPAIGVIIYALQTFVCLSCGKIFKAPLPGNMPQLVPDLGKLDQNGQDDFDEVSSNAPVRIYTVGMVLSLIMERFFKAVPLYRLAQVLKMAGIPLSPSTQYTILKTRFERLALSLFAVLKKEAAQQKLFINDDTFFRILEYERKKDSSKGSNSQSKRSQTSAIVAKGSGISYCLFETSQGHAGNFLEGVLKLRDSLLPTPLQMSDALIVNGTQHTKTIRGLCLDHARRKFFALKATFPADWKKAKVLFGAIYHADAKAKELGLNEEQRLSYHQEHSLKSFDELLSWCHKSLEGKAVEEHSGLGKAMKYFINQSQGLKAFLEVPGMPIASIEVERTIKKFVLLRKNSLQFKTQKGASFGDAIMSLIATCMANQINPQGYFQTLLENPEKVLAEPEKWLPNLVGQKIN